MNKIKEHRHGFVVFDNSVEDSFVPIECPVCNLLMKMLVTLFIIGSIRHVSTAA